MATQRQGPVYAIVNPIHRSHRRIVARIEAQARSLGRTLTIVYTTPDDPGSDAARTAVASGATLVVVVGGDGTVRAVAGVLAGTGVPLGIIPTGTANLFARNLRIRTISPQRMVESAFGLATRTLDIGWVRYTRDDAAETQAFLVMAGIGHDANTVLATRPEFKRHFGWVAYLMAGIKHLFSRPLEMKICHDGVEKEVATWSVLIGNCGRLPAGIRVFPHAKLDDGLLDTLLVPLSSPWQWLSVAAKGLFHLTRDVMALTYGQTARITVTPKDPTALQLDGDVVTEVTEAEFWVAAAALVVVARD